MKAGGRLPRLGMLRTWWTIAGTLTALLVAVPAAQAGVDYTFAQALSPRGDEGLKPQAVVDSQGRTTVVWYGIAQNQVRVKSVRIAADGTPGAVQTLSRDGTAAGYPTLAVDPQGRVTVAWYVTLNQGSQVEGVRIGADGVAGPAQILSDGEYAFYPQVAVDSTGVATVVWQTEHSSNRIQSRRMLADGSLEPVQTLDDTASGVRDPTIVVDSADRATVVWGRQDGDLDSRGLNNGTIRALRLAPDGTPGATQLLSDPATDAFYPEAAVDSLGRVSVAWTGSNAIYSNRIDEAGVPGSPVQVSGPDGAINPPALGVDSQGRAVLAWLAGGGASLQVVRLGADRTAEPIQSFTPAGFATHPGAPALATDAADRTTILWGAADLGSETALGVRLGSDGSASPISRVSYFGDIGETLDVVAGPNGRVTSVWSRAFGDDTQVEFAQGGPGSRPASARIDSAPPKKTKDRTPTFLLSADVLGASLECKLDRGPFKPCGEKFTPRLKPGRHRISVRATDIDGTDPTPPAYSFKVVSKRGGNGRG